MVNTLKYLRKGGRLTPAVAAIGTVLRIKPVLQIQGEKLDSYAKVKTLKQAKTTMLKAIRSDFEKRFSDEEMEIDIAYTYDKAEADKFKEEILWEYPNAKVYMDPLSLSVSCHIGPGALAVACSRKIPELEA